MTVSVRRVYWATQETVSDLSPTDVNTAGSQDLGTDGALVCSKPTKHETLIWTTTDLWAAKYIGGEFQHGFTRIGSNCGIVSQHAAVVLDLGAYWMGNGNFYVYDGFVRVLSCEVNDYVFNSFNQSYVHLVWALANPQFQEITWYYCSANATSPDRYVTFNYSEQHWTFGTLARVAGVAFQPGIAHTGPVMIDSAGRIYNHETGTAHDAQTLTLDSGPMELGDGDQVFRVQRIVPDDKTLGNVNFTLFASLFPDATESTNGPYTAASPTSVRITARQVRLRITEATASAWRVGTVRLGIIPGGKR